MPVAKLSLKRTADGYQLTALRFQFVILISYFLFLLDIKWLFAYFGNKEEEEIIVWKLRTR